MRDHRSRELDRLLRGIGTGDVGLVRDAWRALLCLGGAAVPLVLAKSRSPAFRGTARGPLARYLGVLLMLLHEIDREVFRVEVMRLGDAGLHPVHRRTVEIMAMRLQDRPAGRVSPDVPVDVASDLGDPAPILVALGC